ncbi:MAG: hypothetical protein DI535_01150 [Citrobacter freundii]|nr:MAG: hypothetical protein DI535_01150 [Citrobacter freundii]
MKKLYLPLLIGILLTACGDKRKLPDVSGIKVDLKVDRFDEAFFAVDTLQMDQGLNKVHQQYPTFLSLFLQNIIGITDPAEVRMFYRYYRPLFDSSQKLYKNFEPVKADIEKAFRYVKYYFPQYKTPTQLIPVIGRLDSRQDLARMANGEYTPDFIGPDLAGISLQFYLGRNFSWYQDQNFVNNVAPLFRSRRFSREYITVDLMKLIADDIFPDKSAGRPLIEQMIEKGKQWWLLDKFMPEAPDSIRTGYTQKQLDWVNANEGLVWTYIAKNEDLYAIDPATLQTYIGEGPFTQGFDQELSPGNIGPWIGRQIVRKFEANNPEMSIQQLMEAGAKVILEGAKYKPK